MSLFFISKFPAVQVSLYVGRGCSLVGGFRFTIVVAVGVVATARDIWHGWPSLGDSSVYALLELRSLVVFRPWSPGRYNSVQWLRAGY